MDITTRLSDLHDGAPTAPAHDVVAADLARGQRALVRRRMWRAAGTGAGVLAVAGVVTALAVSGPSPATAPRTTHQQHHHVVASGAIKLVDYTGPQKHGFDVSQIPDGWVLQDSQPGYLTIAPSGNSTDGAAFVDKLVVFLRSIDDTGPMRGTPVTVNGHPGAIEGNDGEVKTLTWQDGTQQVQVQAWTNLHWDDAQLVTFAEGVTVTADAVAPRG